MTSEREGLPRGAVVAATELGESGAEAIARADAWARRWNAPLVVAHVMPAVDALVPLFPHLYQPLPEPERIAAAAQAVREQVSAATDRKPPDYDIDIEIGSPHGAIVTLAHEIRPRLLVVGASRKNAVERALLGSTAEQIVRHAPCEVLVARPGFSGRAGPQPHPGGGGGPIVVATDFSDSALPAERAAAEQARLWDKEIVVVHALDVFQPITTTFEPAAIIDDATLASLKSAAAKLAAASLERVGARGRTFIEIGEPGRVVQDRAEKLGAWLVVVATHGRTGLSRIALGSVAERIIRGATTPVLVARTHAPER